MPLGATSPPPRHRRRRAARLLLAAASLRLLALILAGTSLLAPAALDRLTAPAFADDRGNGNHGGKGNGGNGNGGGNNGGGGNGSGSGNGNGGDNNGGGNGDGSGNGNGNGDGGGNSGASHGSPNQSSGGAALPGGSGAALGGTNPDREGRGGFETGEIVVLGDRPETIAQVESLGFRLIEARPLSALGLSVLKLGTPASLDARQAVALLHAHFPELTADVNSLYGSYETEAAQVVSLPAPDYARQMIHWLGGESCGAGLRIGMIDSALAGGLPVFAGRKLHQRSFLEPGREAADPAHGTAIAALLVGAPDPAHPTAGGLMPAADLYAAAILERQGGRSEANAFAIAAALDWMVKNRVAVVNISLAGDNNALVALAVRRTSERGTVLLAAAGNGGPGAPPAFPGALPEVIAVTAVDQAGAVFPEANRGYYIAFAAPGVRIWTTSPDGQGRYQTGTSFATPFALGAAALEMMQGAPANAEILRRRLAARARALGPGGKNPIFGYGLVQADAACGVTTSLE
jgi:Subtilase family